ncbi:transposase [Mangrovibacterium sp.]|uniref:transposase n=1 Tax=Mangrovibacterium sp. TaxID=1961364 RepID=UPI0035669259
MNPEKLEYDKFYHIYTHGVGGRNIFKETENYEYFLHLYDKYIEPVADTFAWALMPNHLHLLVRIKNSVCYKFCNADRSIDPVRFKELKWQTRNLSACEAPDSVKMPSPEKHISHLLNAYAKYYNTRYEKSGALFERPFNRKPIDNLQYMKHVVLYIHNNPVHHGFCTHPLEYPWTSYLSCISLKPTKIKRDAVVGWFNDSAEFKTRHREALEFEELDGWLGL